MLDIRWIRENKELTETRLASRRGGDEAKVARLLELDTQRRNLLTEVEKLKAERKSASKQIGALMGQKKLEEAEEKKAVSKAIGDRISILDQQVQDAIKEQDGILLSLPICPTNPFLMEQTKTIILKYVNGVAKQTMDLIPNHMLNCAINFH